MTTTYTWKIDNLGCFNAENNNIVTQADWVLTATNDNKSAFEQGTVGFAYDKNSFTPYTELTENDVIAWVKYVLGNKKIQTLETFTEFNKNTKLYKTILDFRKLYTSLQNPTQLCKTLQIFTCFSITLQDFA
jgi:hypothetical protein